MWSQRKIFESLFASDKFDLDAGETLHDRFTVRFSGQYVANQAQTAHLWHGTQLLNQGIQGLSRQNRKGKFAETAHRTQVNGKLCETIAVQTQDFQAAQAFDRFGNFAELVVAQVQPTQLLQLAEAFRQRLQLVAGQIQIMQQSKLADFR